MPVNKSRSNSRRCVTVHADQVADGSTIASIGIAVGSSQSLVSPWQDHPRPSPVNSLQRYIRRSDPICPLLPSILNHARTVRDVLRHLRLTSRCPLRRQITSPGRSCRCSSAAGRWASRQSCMPARSTRGGLQVTDAVSRNCGSTSNTGRDGYAIMPFLGIRGDPPRHWRSFGRG